MNRKIKNIPLLNVRTAYSFLEAPHLFEEIMRWAVEHGVSAIAMTDINNIYGLFSFIEEAARAGIKPIAGAELVFSKLRAGNKIVYRKKTLSVCDSNLSSSDSFFRGPAGGISDERFGPVESLQDGCSRAVRHRRFQIEPFCLKASPQESDSPAVGNPAFPGKQIVLKEPLVVIAVTYRGFENLTTILSMLKLGAFSVENLVRHSEGLAFLTYSLETAEYLRCTGVNRAILAVKAPCQEMFEAERRHLECVYSRPSVFIDREAFELARVLRAIKENSTLSRVRMEIGFEEGRFVPPEEVLHIFGSFQGPVRKAIEFAESIEFEGKFNGFIFPDWRGIFSGEDGEAGRHELEEVLRGGAGAGEVLRKLACSGAFRKYGAAGALNEKVKDRLEYELSIIISRGFADYFLVVREIVRMASRRCGRGSGAASLVAYCLDITDVDPIEHNFYFERFLNPARRDPPDIDIDFPWDERDEILKKVFNKFGIENTAMIANHVTFAPRLAVREIAKVFGLPGAEIKRVTDRIEWYDCTPPSSPKSAPWPEIISLAWRIRNFPRGLSVHCGGVVVTPGPVSRWAPVEMAPKGVRMIGWEKEGVEARGLVKIDLLGNRSLSVIRDTLLMVEENYGLVIDGPGWCPEEDEGTAGLLARGDTMGIFYVESPAMRLLQARTGKGDFKHLVIHSSIIRPAANEYVSEYIRRLGGGEYRLPDPAFNELLDETFGIMVYQEDVSKVAIAMAGFTVEEADALRKILSKKEKKMELAFYREKFFSGGLARGRSEKTLFETWRMIESFAGYSFCKPHSASYARVSFKAAYLKVHYPAEFMAAVISNGGGYYRTAAYISEARRLGLEILGPDVNRSAIKTRGRRNKLRTGLMHIKGLSERTMKRIIVSREKDGPFLDFMDFLSRTGIEKADARRLIMAGALDSLGFEVRDDFEDFREQLISHKTGKVMTRQEMLYELMKSVPEKRFRKTNQEDLCSEYIAEQNRVSHNEKPLSAAADNFQEEVQGELFEPDLFTGNFDFKERAMASKFPACGELSVIRDEFQALGFLVSRHPLDLYDEEIAKIPHISAADLKKHAGKEVTLIGMLVTAKPVLDSKDNPMEFVTFEDRTGLFETVIFARQYRKLRNLVIYDRPLVVSGKVEEEYGVATLTVKNIELLERRISKKNTV